MTNDPLKAEAGFDDRDGWIWFDGRLVPWREANAHVLTHALHYASAVFEGQRAYGGEVFKLAEHSARLKRSAEMLGFAIPWAAEEIDRACRDVLRANRLEQAYVRPVAWRGSERMSVAGDGCRVHLAICAWEWASYFDEAAARRGLRLDLAAWRRPPPECAPAGAKASSLYAICTLAADAARAKGLDDALMLDWRGRIAEATGANVFFVRDGAIHTPAPDCILDGITRRTVIDLARRRGLEVVEREIGPEELEGFEQCFLTGSAAEVAPVSSVGAWSFEVGEPTLQLRRAYLEMVNGAAGEARAA